MVGVGEGAVPVLGGGAELAVAFDDGAEHGQRFAGRGRRGGRGEVARSFGMDLVVAGQGGDGAFRPSHAGTPTGSSRQLIRRRSS